MKRFKLISLAFSLSLAIGAFSTVSIKKQDNLQPVLADSISDYYSEIDNSLTGNDLLAALNTLNKKKKTKNFSYKDLRTLFRYVDRTDDTPEDKQVGFYNNASIKSEWDNGSTWNREHMWPNSRGGSAVEGDLHMTRPTSVQINSDRGNKFFATGVYDPGQYYAPYRGISARIIFYSAIAAPSLTLVDLDDDDESNKTMGKLSDLLKWNLEYLPDTSESASLELKVEQYRNNAIATRSDLQGNRNPFIDHPEFACRIWGRTNAKTREICGLSGQDVTPTSVNLNKNTLELEEGRSEKLTYSFEPENATNEFTWSSSNSTIATVNNGTVAAVKEGQATITITSDVDANIKATCLVTVTKSQTPVDPDQPGDGGEGGEQTSVAIEFLSLDKTSVELKLGETSQIALTVNPENASTDSIEWKIFNTNVATIENGVITAVAVGETTLAVFDTNNPSVVARCKIKVVEDAPPANTENKKSCGGNIATTSIVLSTISVIGISLLLYKRRKER